VGLPDLATIALAKAGRPPGHRFVIAQWVKAISYPPVELHLNNPHIQYIFHNWCHSRSREKQEEGNDSGIYEITNI